MSSSKHNHYFKDVSNIDTIDVYRVLDLFSVTDPCVQHAVKKLLVAGGRGAGKDITRDIQEAIDSLERWKDMQLENAGEQKEETQTSTYEDDMFKMYNSFGMVELVKILPPDQLKNLLDFRISLLSEELGELVSAAEARDSEEIVDALVDIVVVAIGTAVLLGVDFTAAWNEVLRANTTKVVGLKEGRTNPFGMPDLVKPSGWKAPTHQGNHGILPTLELN